MDAGFFSKFAQNVTPNVSPLEGNSIVDDERVSYGLVANTSVGSNIESVAWSDSIIKNCRFENTLLSNSSFERVAIIDCDLSGVTFSNCLLRECVIIGIKAQSYLSLDNCIVDRMMIARSRIEKMDVHYCNIVDLKYLGIESDQVSFHECKAHRKKGNVSFQECEISKFVGVDLLGKSALTVQVDAGMWRDLGDYYLKGFGFEQHTGTALSDYGLLDELSESIAPGTV